MVFEAIKANLEIRDRLLVAVIEDECIARRVAERLRAPIGWARMRCEQAVYLGPAQGCAVLIDHAFDEAHVFTN